MEGLLLGPAAGFLLIELSAKGNNYMPVAVALSLSLSMRAFLWTERSVAAIPAGACMPCGLPYRANGEFVQVQQCCWKAHC